MSESLYMAVRMALIPEISRQNYDTLAKQLREVVANAMDAKASSVSIKVQRIVKSSGATINLILADDGYGMSADEFKHDYLGIGGSWKSEASDTIGRIGIGSLAIAVLGRRLRIETRKEGTDQVLVAELWVGDSVRGTNRTDEVQNVKVGEILEIRAAHPDDPPHFTRLTLFEVYDGTASILEDKDRFRRVIEELERILPLKYPEEHPLLKKMYPQLREVLLDPTQMPTIAVSVSAPCLGAGARDLERYAYGHPSREDETIAGFPYAITPQAVPGGVNDGLTMFGYFVDAGHNLPEERQGVVIRVKNMGVELHSTFESDDAAANPRITGELFLENLDEQHAMTINRNELVKEHPDYIAVRDAVAPLLREFIRDVRGRVALNSQIKKQVDRAKGVREALKSVASALDNTDIDLSNVAPDPNSSLDQADDIDVTSEIRELNDGIVVYTLPDIPKSHDIKHLDDEVQVTIQEELLDNTITIGDREFTYFLKKGNPEGAPCEVHADIGEIFLNVNHPVLASRGDQVIRAVISLRFAYLEAQGDADRLYESTLQILGRAFM